MLIEVDKAGAEWVIVAYAANDARMIETCNSDESPHVCTAELLSGVPRDLVKKENKIVGSTTDPDEVDRLRHEHMEELFSNSSWFLPRSMSLRQAGKKSNHGLNYGMKFRRFALENEMPEAESKDIIELYHQAYPGIRIWWDLLQRQLAKDRTLKNYFGRTRKFYDQWSEQLFEAAYSFIPQSTVADIVHKGMLQFWYGDDPETRCFELMAQVHDSILFQSLSENIQEIARAIVKIAQDQMRPKLRYSGHEFYVESTVKVGMDWGTGMRELPISHDVDEVAANLEKLAGEQGWAFGA